MLGSAAWNFGSLPKLKGNRIMPVSKKHIPSYRLHKASGQAVVTLNGRDVYLGKINTKASRTEYARVIGEWESNGRNLPPANIENDITINTMIERFWIFAEEYYCNPDGTPSRERDNYRSPLQLMINTYGLILAKDFGPMSLKAVRDSMIQAGWSRKNINRQINRLRYVFKWAGSMELIPISVYQSLQTIDGLKRGRSKAVESQEVKPVPLAYVDAVQDYVSPQIWAMIQLQLLTGARPGEIMIMRAIDIDASGKVWMYKPKEHKTSYIEHERLIYLGPRAQNIIMPYMSNKPVDWYLFSPADAEQDRRMQIHALRITPMNCGNRPGSNRKRKPNRKPRDHYDVNSYRRAIQRACDRAFPHPEYASMKSTDLTVSQREELKAWQKDHHWSPNQLRHNRATELRKEFGIDAARIILGHSSPQVTEIYAELDHAKAEEIMAQVG